MLWALDKSIYLYFANLTLYYFYRIQCIFQFSTYLLCLEHDFTNIIMFLSTKEYYSWRCPIWFFQNNVIKWKSSKFNRQDKREFILEFFLGFPACDFRPFRGGSRILHEWFAPTKLGGFGGMLPQENLKFSALKVPFSCVLRAPQAIQTHKQYLLQKDIILYKYSLLCLTIQGNIFLSRSELCLSVSKGSSKWISIDKSVDKPTRLLQFPVE